MTKKSRKTNDLVKREPLTDEETVKIITELADLYGIEYELKIKTNNMEDKTKRIAELFKQEMQKAPVFKPITKFLWLPKSINGEWKWLVNASWQEQFVEVIDQEAMDNLSISPLVWTWKPVKWL